MFNQILSCLHINLSCLLNTVVSSMLYIFGLFYVKLFYV
jgi:hypothetical protein